MEGGIKGVQDVAEKIPAILTTPLVIRVIVPGLLISGVLYPFVSHLHDFWAVLLTFKINATTYSLQRGPLLLVLSAVLWGVAVTSSNSIIYAVYSGRSFWPPTLHNWMLRRRQEKVKRLLTEAEALKSGNRYDRLWYKLKGYPIHEDGDPHASTPTALGNILAEFEGYPKSRYGMDGAFYWKRLWLSLEREQHKEIDSKWCIGDGLLYISAVCNCGAILWLLAALTSVLGWPPANELPWHSQVRSLLGAFGLLSAAFLAYLACLPFQRNNGDIFKMTFDLYRPQIVSLLAWGPVESHRWRVAWAYLQYLRIECVVCERYYSALLSRCNNCNYLTELSIRALEEQKSPSSDGRLILGRANEEAIRRRAHEIYEHRQAKQGFALNDWLRAENELVK